MSTSPFTRPRTTLDLHAPGGIAALFAATRAEFGGHAMTATATEGGQQTDGGSGGQEQQQASAQDGQQQAGAQPQDGPGDADLEPRDGEDVDAFLQRVGAKGAAKLALRYRTEAGDRRQQTLTAQQQADQKATEAREQERQQLLDQLKPGLIALGVLKADETPDPEKLAEKAQQAERKANEQAAAALTVTLENAALRAAYAQGVNVDRLLDSRSFADTLAKLDPTADGFSGKVSSAIEAAVKKDPSLKGTRAVPAAGVPHVGGSGGNNSGGVPTLDAAVAARVNSTR